MKENLGVRIIYRNNKLEPVGEKTYPLCDYTDMLKTEMLRLISDMEDLVYEANGNQPKDEWGDGAWIRFCKIKHKI